MLFFKICRVSVARDTEIVAPFLDDKFKLKEGAPIVCKYKVNKGKVQPRLTVFLPQSCSQRFSIC